MENHPGPWPDVPEPHDTYLDNALEKARAIASALGEPAIADDSGIEADALDGGPGPRSARFAGEGASDAENLAKLVEVIADEPSDARTARYRCVAAIAWPDGRALHAEGVCEGSLVATPRGAGGSATTRSSSPRANDARWPSSRTRRRTGSATAVGPSEPWRSSCPRSAGAARPVQRSGTETATVPGPRSGSGPRPPISVAGRRDGGTHARSEASRSTASRRLHHACADLPRRGGRGLRRDPLPAERSRVRRDPGRPQALGRRAPAPARPRGCPGSRAGRSLRRAPRRRRPTGARWSDQRRAAAGPGRHGPVRRSAIARGRPRAGPARRHPRGDRGHVAELGRRRPVPNAHGARDRVAADDRGRRARPVPLRRSSRSPGRSGTRGSGERSPPPSCASASPS